MLFLVGSDPVTEDVIWLLVDGEFQRYSWRA
jgi:hypothetical protein